jgi:hypothetical protein
MSGRPSRLLLLAVGACGDAGAPQRALIEFVEAL